MAVPSTLLTFGAAFLDTFRFKPLDAEAPSFLSWGFPKIPSAVLNRRVHSRSTVSPRRFFGPALPDADLVPSSRFPTASTAFSSPIATGCCTRLPTMGFTTFPPAAKPAFP
jgi:hypothetical protein